MLPADYDAIVVGGGPAGAVASVFLARAGARTLLVDKARFPRDKVCGDAVCGPAVELVRELGLERQVLKGVVCRARGERFIGPNGETVSIAFPAPTSPEPAASPGYVIRRLFFDDLLFQHARAHPQVTVAEGLQVTDLLREGQRVTGIAGVTREGSAVLLRARVVIGADGALSKVAQCAGAYDFAHRDHQHWIAGRRGYYEGVSGVEDRLEIHFLEEVLPGYLWIFPAGGGLANVGVGMLEADVRGELGPKRNLRRLTGSLLAAPTPLGRRFARAREVTGSCQGWLLPCGSERRLLCGEGWMLAGDAAALVDPFSGEGIANAMVSGRFAAEAAAEALRQRDFGTAALRPYEERVWRTLGPQLGRSHRLQRVLRYPRLVSFVVGRAAKSEAVRRALTEMVADQSKTAELGRPGFYARLLFG